MTIRRYDQFEIKGSHRTPEGYLICQGTAAKAGVLLYLEPDGSMRRELVTEAELSRADSLGSIGLKPVTDSHPPGGQVTAKNARDVARGTSLQKVTYANGYVDVEILVTDEELIQKIDRGDAREISLGYNLEGVDDTPGVDPVYGPYDAKQIGRMCNHVAIVPRGRAGPEAALRVDAADIDTALYRDDGMGGYWGVTDPNLPWHVRDMDDDHRAQWLDVFWEAFWDQEPEDGTPIERRERAEEIANETVQQTREDEDTVTHPNKKKKPARKPTSKKPRADRSPFDDLKRTLANVNTLVDKLRVDEGEENEDEDGDPGDMTPEELREASKAIGAFVASLSEMEGMIEDMQSQYDEQRAQLDAMLDEYKKKDAEPANADEDAPESEDEDMNQDTARGDSATTREDEYRAWHAARKRLDGLAEVYRVDNADDLGNSELAREICKAHFGAERVDGANDAEVRGFLKAIEATRERRADSYEGMGERVHTRRREDSGRADLDAEQRYRMRQLGRADESDTVDVDRLASALAGVLASAKK